jgi:hypothetical protein
MVRRKGEMTSAQLDREFPHQIILPAACYSGTNYRFVHAFCGGLSLATRGHAVVKDGEWHHVFCLSKREDAEKLKQRFGGDWFNPETRGRGKSWHLLREPKKRVC